MGFFAQKYSTALCEGNLGIKMLLDPLSIVLEVSFLYQDLNGPHIGYPGF